MESHVIQELQRIGQIVDAAKDVNLRQNRFVDAVRVRNLETRQDQEGQRESQEQNQQGNQDWKSNPTLKAELVATSMS
jgi:hypothetical protein